MSKHTPGPWKVDETCGWLAIESAKHGNVGLVNLARASNADAKLMAAAPDLAEALRAIEALDGDWDQLGSAQMIARAALAKAGL